MLGNYFKKKFGKDKDVPSTEQFYSPLRIALHSTVSLQTIDILTMLTDLHPSTVLPNGNMEVLAIGTLEFDGNPVYQVYLQDEAEEEFVLQLAEVKNYRTQEPEVAEAILYKQVVTIEPETETSLERYLGQIGFDTIPLDDVDFDRLWGDSYTEKLEFRTYNEKVVTPAGLEQYTDNYILYGREVNTIAGPTTEYLLVGLEENDSKAQIMMQLGLKLNLSDISVQ